MTFSTREDLEASLLSNPRAREICAAAIGKPFRVSNDLKSGHRTVTPGTIVEAEPARVRHTPRGAVLVFRVVLEVGPNKVRREFHVTKLPTGGEVAPRGPTFVPRSFGGYREPSLTKGEARALPESRPEVVAEIVDRVCEGAYRQEFSNGEFTSRSLCVALSFEDLAKVETLEVPGYSAHYDEALGLWWREGGSFD